ncbi:hypothetical protein LX64_04078 [Chitinophaga skermanii]|uniref:Uncharacterized protein n=1 Tax=Chitinophaga skermanii TaxID=331697 RepID=A0A327Q912_9BACT|nr:hypothetical protein [Chitinophaga skermanii]RAJ00374.1 hypothetical protein LX64_04078 [Chitinophaga skermanii]
MNAIKRTANFYFIKPAEGTSPRRLIVINILFWLFIASIILDIVRYAKDLPGSFALFPLLGGMVTLGLLIAVLTLVGVWKKSHWGLTGLLFLNLLTLMGFLTNASFYASVNHIFHHWDFFTLYPRFIPTVIFLILLFSREVLNTFHSTNSKVWPQAIALAVLAFVLMKVFY